MKNPNETPVGGKRSYLVVGLLACVAALALVAVAATLTYFRLRTSELRAPLTLALPDCRAGQYTRPDKRPASVWDDIENDLAKRACEGAKGFEGEAVLVRGNLTLKIHNADYAPLELIQVRLILRPKYATSFQREYRLDGKVAPLSDGELKISTNLDSANLRSFSAIVTWLHFEEKGT